MMSRQAKQSSAHAPLLPAGRTLGIIGAGVMGRTLMKGLLRSGTLSAEQAWASAKTQATCENVAQELGVPVEVDYRGRISGADMILVCVKPHQAPKVLAGLHDAGLSPNTLMISIMAGTSTAQLETLLGTANPWVRAMP